MTLHRAYLRAAAAAGVLLVAVGAGPEGKPGKDLRCIWPHDPTRYEAKVSSTFHVEDGAGCQPFLRDSEEARSCCGRLSEGHEKVAPGIAV